MAVYNFMTVDSNNVRKRLVSSGATIDFDAIRLGSSNLLVDVANDGSDYINFNSNRVGGLAAPTADADAATKLYVDTQVAALGTASEWKDSVLSVELDSANISSPSTGDRYLIAGTGVNDFAGQDNDIAEWNGSAWEFTTPTAGTFTSADDETDRIYYFGGSSWTAKFWENTTASTGLTKVGTDIQLDSTAAGAGLGFAAGVLSVNVDDSTLEVATDTLQVKAGGITESELATSVAGNGLTGGGGTPLTVTADVTGGANLATVLDVNANGVAVKIDDSTIGQNGSSQLEVKDGGIVEAKIGAGAVTEAKIGTGAVTADKIGAGAVTEAKIGTGAVTADKLGTGSVTTDKIGDDQVTAAKLAADTAGSGLVQNGTSGALDVNVDDSTLEVATDTLQVKAAGITETEIAASVAGNGLKGGAGTALAVEYADSFTNDNAATVSANQIVYIKSNGNIDLAIATLGTTLAEGRVGIVEDATIATTASGKVVVKEGALVSGFTGLTPGKRVWVDRSTAGAYTQSLTGFQSGEAVYKIGRAISATEIIYDPEFDFIY